MRSQLAAKHVRCRDFESVAIGSRNFFRWLFLVFTTTHALHFFSQENFFVVIENKIHFFLVAFATDFYSQARWREQPQSVCE
jgi:hypothetical protein